MIVCVDCFKLYLKIDEFDIEIENHAALFSWSTWLRHGPLARAPKDDFAQYGGHTPANTKSCSLGLQCIYMLFAGWDVCMVKNCDQVLFKPEVTVFHYTDQPLSQQITY